MAKNNNLVLLGYEDEIITEKHKGQVDLTTNKIGGEADFPQTLRHEKCILCSLCKFPCRLIVQIYAPLENSGYHRTLYVFACINPTCWNKSESWKCLRVQIANTDMAVSKEAAVSSPKLSSSDWCSQADDWGDDDNSLNLDEENCNVINNTSGRISEDEESSSFDDSMKSSFRNLCIDEKNANNGAQGGAVARLHPQMATAEIEANEDGVVVTVETPTTPNTNLEALLQEDTAGMDNISTQVPFVSCFMSVYPEEEEALATPLIDNHIKELLSDYQRKDAEFLCPQEGIKGTREKLGSGDADMEMAEEEYEKSKPLHGDKMFHHFVTKIKLNPEQLLRYHREGTPLLLYSLQEPIRRCKYCQGEQVFEFQLIPTLISKLKLTCDHIGHSNRLDFGTVLVYTCKNSCWGYNDSIKEETIVVQKEMF